MGFLSWMKTSEKAVDTATDIAKDISGGIDVLVYTEEEKAQARQKAVDTWIRIQEAIRNENSERAKTRRILAKYLFQVQMTLVLGAVAVFPFNAGYAGYIRQMAEMLLPWTGAVVTFYFVYYGVENAIKKVKGS